MTLEGLKGELGVPPADLELSLPISTRTAERIACDCTMSRVVLADSMVIDVGRATRTVSAPTSRALRVRDKGCRFPGCDRQVTGALRTTSFSGREVGRTICPTWS